MMDEKSLPPILSGLIPDDIEKALGGTPTAGSGGLLAEAAAQFLGGADTPDAPESEDKSLVQNLLGLVGQGDSPLAAVVGQFLNGEGELHAEATRAAALNSATVAEKIQEFLVSKLKIAPAVAALMAPMLAKLIPGIKKKAAAKKRKSSRKTTSRPKASAKTEKKPKKKTTAKKPAAKKTTSKKTTSKKTTSKRRTGTRGLVLDVDTGGEQ